MNFGMKFLDQPRDFQFFKKVPAPLSLSVSHIVSDCLASFETWRYTFLSVVAVVCFIDELIIRFK